jgi:hypothetical protein
VRKKASLMKKDKASVIRNERGLALVLALMVITLLACMGIWLISQSGNALRITGAYQRIEEALHLAESACWLSIRAIDTQSISLPAASLMTDVTPNDSFLGANQSFGRGQITPQIQSSRDFYNTTPPPGWMMNWQGAYGFYKSYYLVSGTAEIRMTKSKGGNARSVLHNLVEKATR